MMANVHNLFEKRTWFLSLPLINRTYYETLFTYSHDAELIVVEGGNHMITRKRKAVVKHASGAFLLENRSRYHQNEGYRERFRYVSALDARSGRARRHCRASRQSDRLPLQ